jgi:hypothetical protein
LKENEEDKVVVQLRSEVQMPKVSRLKWSKMAELESFDDVSVDGVDANVDEIAAVVDADESLPLTRNSKDDDEMVELNIQSAIHFVTREEEIDLAKADANSSADSVDHT